MCGSVYTKYYFIFLRMTPSNKSLLVECVRFVALQLLLRLMFVYVIDFIPFDGIWELRGISLLFCFQYFHCMEGFSVEIWKNLVVVFITFRTPDAFFISNLSRIPYFNYNWKKKIENCTSQNGPNNNYVSLIQCIKNLTFL